MINSYTIFKYTTAFLMTNVLACLVPSLALTLSNMETQDYLVIQHHTKLHLLPSSDDQDCCSLDTVALPI